MKNFKVQIDSSAKSDIQEGIYWYNSKAPGLGRKFHSEVKAAIESIKRIHFFEIRYADIRCLPLKKFPYMIHYTVDQDQKLIIIRAVFNTHLNPEDWNKRNQ